MNNMKEYNFSPQVAFCTIESHFKQNFESIRETIDETL